LGLKRKVAFNTEFTEDTEKRTREKKRERLRGSHES
jgi:hypothetical protein